QTAHTPKEAERALTRLLGQVDEQRTPNTNATVGSLLDRWLELAQLELTTRDTYQAYLRRHVRPALGTLPLRKLTVDGLDRFSPRLARHGGRCPAARPAPPRGCRRLAPASATRPGPARRRPPCTPRTAPAGRPGA